jgi:hypothetical protein
MTLRYWSIFNRAPTAHQILRDCWNFPRARHSAKARAIAPCCYRAPMEHARTSHTLCATGALPSATLGSAPLPPRTLPNQAARLNSQLHRRPTRAEPQVWQREERAITKKPECGVQRLRHRPPCFPCAAGDSAEPLDSLEASTRCLGPWSRSNESTGFPEARRLHRYSHGIPMVALALPPKRIVELYQAGYGYRQAVTRTVFLVRAQSCVYRAAAAARRRAHPLDAARRAGTHPGRGKTGRRSASSYLPRTIPEAHRLYNFRSLSARRIEIFCENIPEKPSAASNSREINSGRKSRSDVVPKLVAEFVTHEMTVRCEAYGRHGIVAVSDLRRRMK